MRHVILNSGIDFIVCQNSYYGTVFSLSTINRDAMGTDKDKSHPMQAAELRRRAEALLRTKTAEEPQLGAAEESLRFLHELQVHQIELEMQNAELRQARDEVDRALEQYAD